MKVNRERNPYLKRIFSEQPHKYSFDIESGKYFLLDQQGKTMAINPTGTFKPKFRPNYSGFVNHKSRYTDSQLDPSVLHFAPDPEPKTNYHNPMPDKFAGYSQFPYKMVKDFPTYLKKPGEPAEYQRRKAQSLILGKEQKKKDSSLILQYSTMRFNQEEDKNYFNDAWGSMSTSKPLPKQKKKTCYNYKCKYLKQWVFDERGKLELKKISQKPLDLTMGRSFHETMLDRQMKQSKLLSTMALTGANG